MTPPTQKATSKPIEREPAVTAPQTRVRYSACAFNTEAFHLMDMTVPIRIATVYRRGPVEQGKRADIPVDKHLPLLERSADMFNELSKIVFADRNDKRHDLTRAAEIVDALKDSVA